MSCVFSFSIYRYSRYERERETKKTFDSLRTKIAPKFIFFFLYPILDGGGQNPLLKLPHELVGLLRQTEGEDGMRQDAG